MIQVGILRNMFLECDQDWKIRFQKWQHIDGELYESGYHHPNLVSVRILDTHSRYNDLGGKIYTIVFEDEFDYNLKLDRNEMIKLFCENKDDNDMIDFVLNTEDDLGHYNHIPLEISIGDKCYSDKVLYIDLEENTDDSRIY